MVKFTEQLVYLVMRNNYCFCKITSIIQTLGFEGRICSDTTWYSYSVSDPLTKYRTL